MLNELIKDISERNHENPITVTYDSFNDEIFRNFSQIQTRLREEGYFVQRLSKLNIRSEVSSYFVDLKLNCSTVPPKIRSSGKFIVIIDSFFPLNIDFDYNAKIFLNFSLDVENDHNFVKTENIKIIIGMTKDEFLSIPKIESPLRRYCGKNFFIKSGTLEENIQNRDRIFEINEDLFPTENIVPIVSQNPLIYLLEAQMKRIKNKQFSLFDDPIINLINNFESLQLPTFNKLTKGAFSKKSLNECFQNLAECRLNLIQFYNIMQSIYYLARLEKIFHVMNLDQIKKYIL